MSKNKTFTLILIAAVCFVAISITIFSAYRSELKRVKCSNFRTQEQATQYMHEHDAKYLDRNKDGIACESLPKEQMSRLR